MSLMTEQEWQEYARVELMVQYALQRNRRDFMDKAPGFFSSQGWKKLGQELLHRIKLLLDDQRLQSAIAMLEADAEGLGSWEERRTAGELAQQVQSELLQRAGPHGLDYSIAKALIYVSGFGGAGFDLAHFTELTFAILHHFSSKYLDQTGTCQLIRCVFGNPFRRVAIDPAWRTPAIVSLAQDLHDKRRFKDLPILAEALEKGGCTNEDMLQHCRAAGDPTRGCWVIDGLLEKE